MEECCVQIDYAQNWNVKYSREISAVYFDKAQVSVHPMVVTYRNEDNEERVVSFVGASSDTSHAAASTFTYLKALLSEIK